MNDKFSLQFFKLKDILSLGLFAFLSFFGISFSAERAEGVNIVLDVAPDARSLALGSVYLGMPGGLSTVQHNAAQMRDLEDAWVGVSRASLFGGVEYNWFGSSYKLSPKSGVGIALGRMSADGIYRTSEGQIYEGTSSIPTFSIADNFMSLSGFWARDLWSLGLTFHGLYRELDQSGWGLRTDLSGEYHPFPWMSTGVMFQSITSSYASFESGYSEYQSPEMYTGVGFHIPAPYFYGKLHLAWQSTGWFQKKARSVSPISGSLRSSPMDSSDTVFRLAGQRFVHLDEWLSVSGMAAEFNFDAGLSIRGALPELRTPSYYTMGAGIHYKKWLQVDYAFESHPELNLAHRVSLAINWGYFTRKQVDGGREIQNSGTLLNGALDSSKIQSKGLDPHLPLDTLPKSTVSMDSTNSIPQKTIDSGSDKNKEESLHEEKMPPILNQENPLKPFVKEDEPEEVLERK
jgi:hypothetical protein